MLEIDAHLLAQKGANRHELLLDVPTPEPGTLALFGFGPKPQILAYGARHSGRWQHMVDTSRIGAVGG
ncbi:MAG: PEP-CTERM sorting domain-containing protein [Hyphomicrobiales bacterium]|nr:PEP-CTERM sorting domain-containing protein [Hyphomicrobiales bacterium]